MGTKRRKQTHRKRRDDNSSLQSLWDKVPPDVMVGDGMIAWNEDIQCLVTDDDVLKMDLLRAVLPHLSRSALLTMSSTVLGILRAQEVETGHWRWSDDVAVVHFLASFAGDSEAWKYMLTVIHRHYGMEWTWGIGKVGSNGEWQQG